MNALEILKQHCAGDDDWSRAPHWIRWGRATRSLHWLLYHAWGVVYAIKALIALRINDERPKDEYDFVVVAMDNYQPDWEYSHLGSWDELQVGHGWRPRTWWAEWGTDSSV